MANIPVPDGYTLTLGYYNNHDFPLNITSSALGINITVPKKSFVIDREGNLINDSRLGTFAMLSKHFSPTPVPLRIMAGAPTPPGGAASHGGSTSPLGGFSAGGGATPGRISDMVAAAQAQGGRTAGPITAMTLRDAERAGLTGRRVAPNIDELASAPVDDGKLATSANAPYIDSVMRARPMQAQPTGLPALKSGAVAPSTSAGADAVKAALSEAEVPGHIPAVAPVISVTPVTPASVPHITIPVPETPKFEAEFEGKKFNRLGDLRAAVRRKHKDDKAAVNDITRPYEHAKELVDEFKVSQAAATSMIAAMGFEAARDALACDVEPAAASPGAPAADPAGATS